MAGRIRSFLADAGIRREHSIRDTQQQLGVAERLNRTLDEGITTLVVSIRPLILESGLVGGRGGAFSPWQVKNRDRPALTGKRGSVDRLLPFGCLHLQRISAPCSIRTRYNTTLLATQSTSSAGGFGIPIQRTKLYRVH